MLIAEEPGSMNRGTAVLLAFGCLVGLSVQGLAGASAAVPVHHGNFGETSSAVVRLNSANFGETSPKPGGAGPKLREGGPAPAVPASPSEYVAVERFLANIEKPPVAYQARRRLEASSAKLNESAWMEAVTQYDPTRGFTYSIVAQGGSDRIRRRVLKAVLEAERENSTREEWHKGNLSHANYEFGFGGHAGNGMLKMQLTPRRRDSRLVLGSALLTAKSGNLIRIEGRLSKSPSIWVRSVNVSRTYSPVAGLMMPVEIESTADVRIAGMSKFSMTYDYDMVNGHAVNAASKILASR